MFWCWGFLKDGFFKVFVKIIVLKTKKKNKESFLKTIGKIHGNVFLGNFVKACRSIFLCVCLLMSRLKQAYFFVLRYIRTSLRGVFWKKNFCQNFKNLFICVITFCQRSPKYRKIYSSWLFIVILLLVSTIRFGRGRVKIERTKASTGRFLQKNCSEIFSKHHRRRPVSQSLL